MRKILFFVIAVLIVAIGGMLLHISDLMQDAQMNTSLDLIDTQIQECYGSSDCFGEIFLSTAREQGLPAGFTALKQIYEATPAFRPICHGAARHFVKLFYAEQKDYTELEITPESTWCNYAFQQAYPEALLLDIKDPKEAVDLCTYMDSYLTASVPGAEAECYRGIGRAIPHVTVNEYSEPEVSAKVLTDICFAISADPSNQQACVNGVFNALADLPHEDQKDPLIVCNELTGFLKENCFSNSKTATYTYIDRSSPEGIENSLATINELFKEREGDPAKDVVFSYGYSWAGDHTVVDENTQAAAGECSKFSDEVRRFCLWGVAVGIAKSGTPNTQYALLADFCKQVQQSMGSVAQEDCPSSQALGYLQGIYSKDAFNEILAYMEDELGFRPVFTEEGMYGY